MISTRLILIVAVGVLAVICQPGSHPNFCPNCVESSHAANGFEEDSDVDSLNGDGSKPNYQVDSFNGDGSKPNYAYGQQISLQSPPSSRVDSFMNELEFEEGKEDSSSSSSIDKRQSCTDRCKWRKNAKTSELANAEKCVARCRRYRRCKRCCGAGAPWTKAKGSFFQEQQQNSGTKSVSKPKSERCFKRWVGVKNFSKLSSLEDKKERAVLVKRCTRRCTRRGRCGRNKKNSTNKKATAAVKKSAYEQTSQWDPRYTKFEEDSQGDPRPGQGYTKFEEHSNILIGADDKRWTKFEEQEDDKRVSRVEDGADDKRWTKFEEDSNVIIGDPSTPNFDEDTNMDISYGPFGQGDSYEEGEEEETSKQTSDYEEDSNMDISSGGPGDKRTSGYEEDSYMDISYGPGGDKRTSDYEEDTNMDISFGPFGQGDSYEEDFLPVLESA